MNPETAENSGCLIRGCLFFTFAGLVLASFCGLGAYTTYKDLYALTSDKPLSVAIDSGAGYAGAKQRLDAFHAQELAQNSAVLKLSAADLNAFIAGDPELSDARGRVHFEMKSNKLIAQVSIPLTGVRGMQNRWFNGDVMIEPRLEHGRLVVIPKSIQSGAVQAPIAVLWTLGQFAWSDAFIRDAEIREMFAHAKSIHLEDDALVIEF